MSLGVLRRKKNNRRGSISAYNELLVGVLQRNRMDRLCTYVCVYIHM